MKKIYCLFFIYSLFCSVKTMAMKEFFISPNGSDTNSGTKLRPFASFSRANEELKKIAGREPVTIWFYEGVYHLKEAILFNSEVSGTAENPIIISSLPGAIVKLKGSKTLNNLKWNLFDKGIYATKVPKNIDFDQLFVNGNRKIRSRYPNYDYENPLRGGKGYLEVLDGTDKRYDTWFTLKKEDFPDKKWQNPSTGIVHAFQSHNWGNMQYRISGINIEEQKILLGEGGWQLQRSLGIGGKGKNLSLFFIDNIFEELDTPGEWFLDVEKNMLYYYPEEGIDVHNATFEVPVLKDLIQIKGDAEKPVKHITINGLEFSHSKSTFMELYEPLARGDWAIHRGGAIFLQGTENCTITNNNFEYLGGNGVFLSGYNRNNIVSNSRFVHVGESAVAFVGLPSAVRFYQTWDDRDIDGKNWDDMRKNMDLEPGPKSLDYPKNCIVENNIMHDFGDYGKQVAGVYISMSHKIKVAHNTIYNCPRAGICINDGTWGGHVIEFNDIWETVRETGEHGPFNSWGRERQWRGSRGSDEHFIKKLTKLDAIDNVIVRNNRIANYRKSISAGNWTIDLDDGSSYYEIYNNLSLGSTIKLRDGMSRKVFNNITVSAVPLGFHVWPKDSEDEIYNNIFVISGALPGKKEPTKIFLRDVGLPTETKWSKHYDHNLYWNINYPSNSEVIKGVGLKDWQNKGYDEHAVSADPMFVNVEEANYQVKENSPALKLGFKNFPMDSFGHEMTRIIPFGGDFSDEISVTLKKDVRANKKAKIYYTLDGTEPNQNSMLYEHPIQIRKSSTIKAITINPNGISLGFTNEVKFNKVNKVVYPSWYDTLLKGEYKVEGKLPSSKKALELEIEGAVMINIADDPDLIDATGGYNYGCYIKEIDSEKGKMWLDASLDRDWVIQKINGNIVKDIKTLQKLMRKHKGEQVTLIGVRDYREKEFKINFKKN